jgi:hypothetical protein
MPNDGRPRYELHRHTAHPARVALAGTEGGGR